MKLSLIEHRSVALGLALAAFSSCAALGAFGSIAACATSTRTVYVDAVNDGGAGADGGEAGSSVSEDEDDVTKQPPHSLGTITLGEAHGSSGSTKSTPIVSATFVPDALMMKSCTKKIAGCTIAQIPKCSGSTTSSTGCLSGEACTFDDTCKPVCKKVAVCDKTCASDEVCKPPTIGTSSGTCVKRGSFDAGPLAFSGTTTPITMYPPYQFESTGQGAPFLAGTELRVQAQGATEAGFEKFDEKFTATTFIQTKPALSKIPREKIFGEGDLPVEWVPGTDAIVVTVTGAGGSATCKVNDAAGKFDVPREVVEAAQGDLVTSSSSSLSLTVSRQKKDVKKDKKAQGEVAGIAAKPEAWLELVTLSSETASFAGCGTSQTICGETCCSSTQTCQSGVCTTGTTSSCPTCRSNAAIGTCSSYRSTCVSNTTCNALWTCVQACSTTACVSNCEASYPSGVSLYQNLKTCTDNACFSSCP